MPERSAYRVVIIGAGFGGIGMALALKQAGMPLDRKVAFGLWEWGTR